MSSDHVENAYLWVSGGALLALGAALISYRYGQAALATLFLAVTIPWVVWTLYGAARGSVVIARQAWADIRGWMSVFKPLCGGRMDD